MTEFHALLQCRRAEPAARRRAGARHGSLAPGAIGQFAGDDSYVQGRDWQALLRLLDRIDPSYKD